MRDAFIKLPIWGKYLSLALLGLLAVFAFAPFFIAPLFALALIILLWALDDCKEQKSPLRAGFARAFVFAFFHFALGMFWVGQAFLVDAEKFAWLLPFAVTALPAFIALFYGIMGLIYVKFAPSNPARILWFALCFSIIEYIRGHAFTGLPWNLSAYIFEAGSPFSQIASIIGPYGMGLLIVFISASLAITYEDKKYFTLALALGFFAMIFGIVRMPIPEKMPKSEILVATAQAGFSQKDLWNPENKQKVFDAYIAQLKTENAKNAGLIVWPEGTFPSEFFTEPELLEAINPLIANKILVVGAPRADVKDDKLIYYNSLAFITGSKEKYPQLLALYDKNHLVPFGEYLPFRSFFNAIGIESLVAYGTDFSKSEKPQTIKIPGLFKIEPRICYEIIFPNFGKITERGDVIVNASVDAWYGDFLGPDQHYNQARFRAIEEGKPLIRAAAGGWSGIIDPYGRVSADFRKGNNIVAAFPAKALGSTIYSQYGELIYFLLIVVFLTLNFRFFRKN